MSGIEVCKDGKDWALLLQECPAASVFDQWDWLKLMERHSTVRILGKTVRAQLYPLVWSNGNKPSVLFPVYVYNSPFLNIASSPPSRVESHCLGPLLIGSENLKTHKIESNLSEFVKDLDAFLFSELNVKRVNILAVPGFLDVRHFKWSGYTVTPEGTYFIDLSPGLDAPWAALSKSLRKKINASKEKGISIRLGTREDVKAIAGSLARRRHEQGDSRRSSEGFLLDCFDSFNGKDLEVLVAEKDNAFVSGLILLYYKGHVVNWVGNAKPEQPGLYPNELLVWEGIKRSINKGMKTYEIPGANVKELYSFKSFFNPRLVQFFSMRKTSGVFRHLEAIYRFFKPYND